MQHDIAGLSIDTQISVQQNALVILVAGKLKVRGSNESLLPFIFVPLANGVLANTTPVLVESSSLKLKIVHVPIVSDMLR